MLAAVISALKVTGQSFRDQRLVVFGSGTAGCGIADALRDAMIHDGASRAEAIGQVWLVDKQGLLSDDMADLRNYQQPYARPAAEVKGWGGDGTPDLLDDHQAREADDPARHLDRPRGIHQADHRCHVRRCRATDHPADLQPDLEDRGDAL